MPHIESVSHVQLPVPVGGLQRARDFYHGLLGLDEVLTPGLARPGTLNFALGWQRLDVREGSYSGVAPQALLALRVRHCNALVRRLAAAGLRVQSAPMSDHTPRFYVEDPFGNRLELVEVEGPRIAFANPRPVTQMQISI